MCNLKTFPVDPDVDAVFSFLTVEIQSKCGIFIHSVLGKPDPSTAVLYMLLSQILSLSDARPKVAYLQPCSVS